MKSLVMKSIYAGLGLLGEGKKSVQQLAHELARKANVSEKEGERIAKQLRHHSEKAIHTIQKTLNAEVNMAVKAIHAATKTTKKKRKASSGGKTHRRAATRTGGSRRSTGARTGARRAARAAKSA